MQDHRCPRQGDINFRNRYLRTNPRDDMKSITNTVAKAMIDSLVHDDLVLKSGTIYVTVMVRYDGMSDGIRVYP
jgi:hypothetical protein